MYLHASAPFCLESIDLLAAEICDKDSIAEIPSGGILNVKVQLLRKD